MADTSAPKAPKHDHEHRHYQLDDAIYVTHAHEHREHAKEDDDFNRLHHHAPQEHAG